MTKTLQDFKYMVAREACGDITAEAWSKGLCISCKQPAAPKCHTVNGEAEYRISAMCEECWDALFADEDEGE